MSPQLTPNDRADMTLRCAVFASEPVLAQSTGGMKAANVLNVLFRKSCASVFLATANSFRVQRGGITFAESEQAMLRGVRHVLRAAYVFKVSASVVLLIAINVVYLKARRAWTNEDLGNESMYVRMLSSGSPVALNYDLMIAMGVEQRLENARFSPRLAVGTQEASDPAHTANFVAGQIRNRFPDFLGVRIGVSHDVHSFVVNGLVRLVQVLTAPVRAVCILT